MLDRTQEVGGSSPPGSTHYAFGLRWMTNSGCLAKVLYLDRRGDLKGLTTHSTPMTKLAPGRGVGFIGGVAETSTAGPSIVASNARNAAGDIPPDSPAIADGFMEFSGDCQ